MNLVASFLYAKRIVFPKKSNVSRGTKSLFGAMICIGISLIPLVAILTVSEGMIDGITHRMIELSSHDLQIYVEDSAWQKSSYQEIKNFSQKIEEISGIQKSYPEISCSALVAGKNYRSGAYIRAVEKNLFQTDKGFNEYFELIDGERSFENQNDAIIGRHLSEVLNLKVGDSFRIITINRAGQSVVPKLSSFVVKGIVSCGYQELDALWIFIPIESALKNLALNSCQFSIGFSSDFTFENQKLFKLQNDVQNFLYSEKSFENSYVIRWDEANRSQFENFSSTKALLLLIVLVILLAASINISSGIVMLVMERKKEIAILKSTGATSFGISFAFLIAGTSCGLGGLLFGLPIGLFVSVNVNEIIKFFENIANFFVNIFNILVYSKDVVNANVHILNPEYYLQKIPVNIPVQKLILMSVFTLVLSMIMAALPSIKAGKEKPINTLRKV